MDADVHEVIRPGDLDRGEGLGVAPAVSGDHATARAAGGNEGEVVDAAGVLNEREGLASHDVGVRRQLEQRDCAVKVVPASIPFDFWNGGQAGGHLDLEFTCLAEFA